MQMPVFLSFTASPRARGAMPALYVPAERQAESVAFSTKVNGGRRRKSWRGEREGRREKKKKEQGRIGTTCARAPHPHACTTTNGTKMNPSSERLCRGKMRAGLSPGLTAGLAGREIHWPSLAPAPTNSTAGRQTNRLRQFGCGKSSSLPPSLPYFVLSHP